MSSSMTANEGVQLSRAQTTTIKAPDEGLQVSKLMSLQLSYMDATDMAVFATVKKQTENFKAAFEDFKKGA
eukprot:4117477-Karenia_brevis.AAC.1